MRKILQFILFAMCISIGGCGLSHKNQTIINAPKIVQPASVVPQATKIATDTGTVNSGISKDTSSISTHTNTIINTSKDPTAITEARDIQTLNNDIITLNAKLLTVEASATDLASKVKNLEDNIVAPLIKTNNSLQKINANLQAENQKLKSKDLQTLYWEMGILASLAVIGVGIGVYAMLNGNVKMGSSLIGAALCVAVTALAIIYESFWIAIIGATVAIIAFIAISFIAIKSHITLTKAITASAANTTAKSNSTVVLSNIPVSNVTVPKSG